MRMLLFTMLTVFCVGITCAADGAADPLTIKLTREKDTFRVIPGDDTVTVKIDSDTGIGGATISPTGKSWPKKLVIEIDIKELEGFTIQQGDVSIYNSEQLNRVDGEWKRVAIDKRFQPHVRKEAARVVISLPPGWLEEGRPELSLEWIDFYR